MKDEQAKIIRLLKENAEASVEEAREFLKHLESMKSEIENSVIRDKISLLIEDIEALKENPLYNNIFQTIPEDMPDEKVLEKVKEIRESTLELYNISDLLEDRFIELKEEAIQFSPKKASASLSSSAPALPNRTSLPTIADNERSWLNDTVIQNVVKRLKELSYEDDDSKKMVLAQELEDNWSKFETLPDEKREAVKKIIKQVVNFPGFGHNEGSPYVYLDRDDINKEEKRIQHQIDNKNLLGMDEILDEVKKIHIEKLEERLVSDPTQKGTSITERDSDDKQVKKPYFWGPPGVGKTVAAKALAKSLDKPMVYLSAEKIKDIRDIFGRGGEWQGGAKLGPVAEAMAAYGSTDLFIFIDELDKIPTEVLLQLTNFLGNPPHYEDAGLGVSVDLSRCTFFLAGNGISCLDTIEHLRSRLEPTYFPGYDPKTQEAILTNRALQLMNKNELHKHIHLCMGTEFDSTPYLDDFEGFSKTDPNIIAYLIENYGTEPGVREIERDLRTIINAARTEYRRTEKNVLIDIDFVKKALGEPDPNVKKIKDLNNDIDDMMKAFNKKYEEIQDHIEAGNDESHKSDVESLIKDLQEQKNLILKNEEAVLGALKRRLNNPKAKRKDIEERIKAHQQCMVDINIRSESLAFEIKKKFPDIDMGSLQAKDHALKKDTSTPSSDPLKLSVHTSTPPPTNSADNPKGNPTLDLPGTSRAPGIATSSQLNQPIISGFQIALRSQKVAKKDGPTLLVSHGGDFNTFCTKEIEKIEKMKDILKDPALQNNTNIINTLKETHKDEALNKAFEDTFKNSPLSDYTTPKSTQSPQKHSVSDRITHKINTAYLYKDLRATRDPSGALLISEETGDNNLKAIICMTRNPDSTTSIMAKNATPDDKHLWLMVEYAREHSDDDGKFTITHCEKNAKAAMKLFVFGVAAGLKPEAPNELTQEAIEDYPKKNVVNTADQKLIEMYKVARDGATAKDLVVLLKDWEATKKAETANRSAPRP